MILLIRARKARTDDAELIRLIRKELIPLSHTIHPLDAHTIRELPLRFRRGVTYVAALSRNSPPISFVHFEAIGELLYVDMLVTHPEHRNRQWGKRLMAHAEAYGKKHNCKVVRLFVDLSNSRAHQFYNKLGYMSIRYFPELRCYELIKPLAPTSAAAFI